MLSPAILPEDEEILVTSSIEETSVCQPSAVKGSSWEVSSLIVCNACLGAGILAFPAAFDQAGGIVAAIVILMIVMIFAGGSILFLGYCAEMAIAQTVSTSSDDRGNRGPSTALSYQSCIGAIGGRGAELICSISILFYTYATCITFLIIIGDQTDTIFYNRIGVAFCDKWYLRRRVIVPILTLIFVMPLCFVKRIDSLKHASSVATGSVFYLVGLLVLAYVTLDGPLPPHKQSPDSWTDVFSVMPTICFGYQCHVSIIPVYSCIEPFNKNSLLKTMLFAFFIISIIYLAFGILGYLAYGSAVNDDVLADLPTENWWFAFGYVMFSLKMFLTYPVVAFCGRLSIDTLLHHFSLPICRREYISILWLLSTLAIAVFVPSISVAIDFLGFLSTAIIFLFPGYCALRLYVDSPDWRWSSSDKRLLVFAVLYLTMGAFIAGVTFVQTLYSLLDRSSKHGKYLCQ